MGAAMCDVTTLGSSEDWPLLCLRTEPLSFPLAMLAGAVTRLAEQMVRAVGGNPALVAGLVLAVAAGVIGRSVRLQVAPEWTAEASVFLACVGPEGEETAAPAGLAHLLSHPAERIVRSLRVSVGTPRVFDGSVRQTDDTPIEVPGRANRTIGSRTEERTERGRTRSPPGRFTASSAREGNSPVLLTGVRRTCDWPSGRLEAMGRLRPVEGPEVMSASGDRVARSNALRGKGGLRGVGFGEWSRSACVSPPRRSGLP
jgi:hypothetical protein